MDTSNGFGIGADCLANSQANGGLGFECKGATRQDVSLDLLFYPTQQITVKVEYRHDWANKQVFLKNDGSYGKSNDLLAAQFIIAWHLWGVGLMRLSVVADLIAHAGGLNELASIFMLLNPR